MEELQSCTAVSSIAYRHMTNRIMDETLQSEDIGTGNTFTGRESNKNPSKSSPSDLAGKLINPLHTRQRVKQLQSSHL